VISSWGYVRDYSVDWVGHAVGQACHFESFPWVCCFLAVELRITLVFCLLMCSMERNPVLPLSHKMLYHHTAAPSIFAG
jgi:hypothetical protein